jgi:hypothetical protein
MPKTIPGPADDALATAPVPEARPGTMQRDTTRATSRDPLVGAPAMDEHPINGTSALPALSVLSSAPSFAAAHGTRTHAAAGALDLLACVLASGSAEAAALRLVAGLAREFRADGVSLGLHRDGRTRLVASTAVDAADERAERQRLVRGAMDEAIEQGCSVSAADGAAPAPPPGRTLPVTLEHAALGRATGGAVATVPVGEQGEIFAAVCLERQGPHAGFAVHEIERLEHLLVLALPALRWREQAEEPLRRRLLRDLAAAAQALRQPHRHAWRRMLAAGAAALLFMAAFPMAREVTGRARLEGAEQRVIVAPADGFVKTVHARPGDRVAAGQPLVDLLDADLRLEHDRLAAQLAQHENAYAAAMARSDRVTAATSGDAMGEAQAQLALVDEQLARGRLVAPFDALVIQGDLAQSAGAPVRQGDTLMTLATPGRERVIVEVDETDIAQVRIGQAGSLSLSALPWASRDIVVERVAPLAHAVEGRNVFDVEARLVRPDPTLRPGLLGHAAVVVGTGPLLASWTRHAIGRLRVTWWGWFG